MSVYIHVAGKLRPSQLAVTVLGLRKAAATVAAENGATAHELMAIFGWLSLKEAERYTRGAERKN
jgi:hypothetical protein